MAFALSSTFCVSRVVARPLAKRSNAARRAAAATPARAVLDDSVDSAPASVSVRRDRPPRRARRRRRLLHLLRLARGLPELECAGELKTAASGLQFCEAVLAPDASPRRAPSSRRTTPAGSRMVASSTAPTPRIPAPVQSRRRTGH